jgi:hypothetical protein
MDAMSPGIHERKESKMPKEVFCKVSLHHKCGIMTGVAP